MRVYKCLSRNFISIDNYSITPIRFEDRYLIMNWRNDQIYHLRQSKVLTPEIQDSYFENVISDSFDQNCPNQILFSYLVDNKCVGYGGLVHIDWENKNAEISFLLETYLDKNQFELHWLNFLKAIKIVAFNDLNFNKIFTYAFDLRPKLYNVLNESEFRLEARLKNHVLIDNKFIDVLIHSNFKDND